MCFTAIKSVSLAHADVAIDILKLLLKEGGKDSKVASPIRLVIVLSMTYAEAKGRTLEEMQKLLTNDVRSQTLH
uniref:SERPIN domain-containing protein n=1 Tax=Rhabditophanes sp. KR3021 TaxID=114890 RepID=A0AC35UGY8_9BILA